MTKPHQQKLVALSQMHKINSLPMIVLILHSGCNCKCVMCDIWKANSDRRELSEQDIAKHLDEFKELGIRMVTLSGGEAMMNANIWTLCKLLRELDIYISLMSTGLMLKSNAENVVKWCDAITISLDGSRSVHDAIRGVPRAFDRLAEGIASVKALQRNFLVVGRCVLQRSNFRDLSNIIHTAKSIGVDVISFLPADVTSEAFNRPKPWDRERISGVSLNREETSEFAEIVEDVIYRYGPEFQSGFIHESPDFLRRLPRYYAALNGDGAFPEVICNAPWISAVVETDQTVRPCYFHPPIGNLKDGSLSSVLNSDEAIAFRSNLNVKNNPVCQKCVCSLYIPKMPSR